MFFRRYSKEEITLDQEKKSYWIKNVAKLKAYNEWQKL